ncbi:MAG: hypothetical protein N4A37_10615 [Prolixibacteraceae bacterium]|jgi:hypothetical protein|nr:hypothetical protein [Prolixibacteraceae bacterium]
MMSVNEKHLELIQSVITRHNSNSFMIKGWTITIVSAILTLAGTFKEPILAGIPIMPIVIFWYLDSFYLANERCFISLYNCVINDYMLVVKNSDLIASKRKKTLDNNGQLIVDLNYEVKIVSKEFSMNHTIFKDIARNNICDTFKSVSIKWFYLMLVLFSILFFVGMIMFKNNKKEEHINVKAQIEYLSSHVKSESYKNSGNNMIFNDLIFKSDTIKENI